MNISTVYVPPVPPDRMIGELRNILLAGVARNSAAKFCGDIDSADYVLLDFRHLEDGIYDPEHQNKTIIVDYRDSPGSVFPHDSFLYFKRSVVNREYNEFQ